MYAHESKVGYTTLTKFVRSQVNKDAFLLREGKVDNITWHFFISPTTGMGGPSIPLKNELERAGIAIQYHF